MSTRAFNTLLEEARAAHIRVPAIREFCAFADDLKTAPVDPRHIPPADLMAGDAAMSAPGVDPLAPAFANAGPDAFWRLTYEGTNLGPDFMDRFGCYCLIGKGGPWISRKMAGYVVYMPSGLHYTWHHHPAEEIYYILAGEGEFFREGEASEMLMQGQSSFHNSNQPHAADTHDKGFMAYVVWRNHLKDPPVLTERVVETVEGQP